MGVLDDAIREHLELKRQHGASEEEVKRQEAEALGASRREAAAGNGDELAPEEAPAEEELPLEGDEEPVLVHEDEPAVPEPELEEPEAEASAPVEEVEEELPRRGDTPPRGFPAVDEHEDLPADEPEEPAADSADSDVLEDTPDFLQETPEHDRLWFEQKPPRDFDFD
jgi:hypothetical protein